MCSCEIAAPKTFLLLLREGGGMHSIYGQVYLSVWERLFLPQFQSPAEVIKQICSQSLPPCRLLDWFIN